MPIYEYQCDACGHYLEALQQLADSPLKKCPDCGKPKLRRLLSAPMFLLKGSGWYETDFKSDKEIKRNLADRPEKEEMKSEAATPSKSDTKTEAATPKAESNSAPDSKRTTVAASKPGKRKAASRVRSRKARRRRA
jgi:putative FmdB family regulatory protein